MASDFPKISNKKLKNSIGGFAWNLFGNLFNISTTDIHNCFDLCHNAKHGRMIDPEIQDDEEAHRKVLRSYSNSWDDNYKKV